MANQPAPTPAPIPAIDPFLHFARTRPVPVLVGGLAAGDQGGQATSFLTFNPNQIPEIPAYAVALDLFISLPVKMTLPAGATAHISPYAPYAGFSPQMKLAGSPEWPNTISLVPFWLDTITQRRGVDPFGLGPCIATPNNVPKDVPMWFDQGPHPVGFASGATTVLPGQTVNNPGGAPLDVHFVMNFHCRIQLQRKPTKMWGTIPLGDPQNRPEFRLQLNGLVGRQPENSIIQDVAAAGITAVVDAAGATCNAVFRSKSLDTLPGSVTQLPTPMVTFGLNVTYDNGWQFQNAGAILYQYQRTAQIYTAIHHLFINNQQPVDPDYFGLWLTQEKQSARWEYDESAGNMQDYYNQVLEVYNRYLPVGHMVADLENGDFPDIPRETPYNGMMSPDVAYAQAAGVAPTPNMSTAARLPAGIGALTGAYAASYAFGLVKVPY